MPKIPRPRILQLCRKFYGRGFIASIELGERFYGRAYVLVLDVWFQHTASDQDTHKQTMPHFFCSEPCLVKARSFQPAELFEAEFQIELFNIV